MKLVLKKERVIGREWANGYRDIYIRCSVNGITLDKRLESANNPNPDLKDIKLCVDRRKMTKETLEVSDKVLNFFNSVKEGKLTLIV